VPYVCSRLPVVSGLIACLLLDIRGIVLIIKIFEQHHSVLPAVTLPSWTLYDASIAQHKSFHKHLEPNDSMSI